MQRKFMSATYIAEIEQKIIGFTSGYINKYKEASIEDLFVLEEYRKEKIGTLLFEKILNWAKENLVTSINIHVSIGNEIVFDFYEKFDFKKTGYTFKNTLKN